VLEGTDGSGKSTQLRLLTERLTREGAEYRTLRFPRYDNPSSSLIRMYLGGEFGADPGDVNAFAASAFYAVDRFASYQTEWKSYYQSGGTLLSDRYTTSNAIHQASKLPEGEREAFWRWLYDFEFGKMGLPAPDLVLCLDMPVGLTERLMRRREEESHTAADIHERNTAYLDECRRCARAAAAFYGWTVVPCAEDGRILPAEEIHETIYGRVAACLEG